MEMTKLTGLWKNTDKNGNTYLSGSLTPISNLMIMPNTYKKSGDKAPDYFVYVAPKEKLDSKGNDDSPSRL